MNYKQKYLKYKSKYLKLKKLSGGAFFIQDDFDDAERTDLDYEKRCEKRKEIDLQINSIKQVIKKSIQEGFTPYKDEVNDETINQIDEYLEKLKDLGPYMNEERYQNLENTLSEIYNEDEVYGIIEETFYIQHETEYPLHSNEVTSTSFTRDRSSISDRKTYTVRNEQEDNPKCNNVFCTIM